MSNLLYPTLPGLTLPVKRSIVAPPVHRKVSPSGREYRTRDALLPTYTYELKYEFLRSGSQAEYQALAGHFNAHGGSFDSFPFLDPDDNTATAALFGTGDGSTTAWQLVRPFGGFAEPVTDFPPASPPLLYANAADWRGTFRLYSAARTNSILWSADFSNAAWNKSAGGGGTVPTVTANYAGAPDGTPTADRIQFSRTSTAGDDYSIIDQSGAFPTTRSIWLKSNTGSPLYLLMRDGSGAIYQELTVPVVWQLFSVSAVGSSNFQLGLRRSYGAVQPLSADVLMWGAQQETGAAATQYIPTTSAAVTAAADYSLGSSGIATFATPPGASVVLTWSGTFYRRVVFATDVLDTERFMAQFFAAGSVKLRSLKAGTF